MDRNYDFVVVANRLPVDLQTSPDGSRNWTPSPGGLVTALTPVLRKNKGCWVGWPGVIDDAPEPFSTDDGVLLHPVKLSAEDYQHFYEGFSNATLWPLYHDLIVTPQYNRTWWRSFREVNQRFAHEVAAVASQGATVWVQDYQLHLVPGMLRELRPDLTIGFFLHIPFPSADLFQQLPWREQLVEGVMGADLIGFQLETNARNFLALARRQGYSVSGQVSTRAVSAHVALDSGRQVGVGAFPISIDSHSMSQFTPADLGGAERFHAELGKERTVILGVDRLDYTKGILQRLIAFEELLESGTLDPHSVSMVQMATPSRERIAHYRAARSKVEEAVGRINGRFGQIGRPVVHYQHTSINKTALRRYYRMADIMMVTPFKDGMNLVAKEYVSCHGDFSGALVLSEFAGAADELTDAFLCNPFDIESIKFALRAAYCGLKDEPELLAARMQSMFNQVQTHDVDLWSTAFLRCLGDKK